MSTETKEESKEMRAPENVQALAASKNMIDIPDRYIRPDLVTDPVIVDGEDIPVIDLGKLLDPLSAGDEEAKFKIACEEWGFFQLINHGVPEEVIQNIKIDLKDFFDLPLEEKKRVQKLQDGLEGYGNKFLASHDNKVDWADLYFLKLQPVSDRNMAYWSTRPSTLRTSLDRYSDEVKKVTLSLLRSLAKSLEIPSEKLVDIFGDMLQRTAMNYYPPCPLANKVMGISPHSDRFGLTLLMEGNGVSGFQIRRKEGWLPVNVLPGAFVVNFGDMLEILTNGKYKSIEHRVTIDPEKERISIATFHSLNYNATIGPVAELVEGNEARYKTMSVESFMALHYSSGLDGKRFIDRFKI